MKSICGYWSLDNVPVPAETLATMRIARLRTSAPQLQEWRSADGSLAFGSAWWSPQADLPPPACIATHPASGCVAIADARLDNPAELRATLALPAPSHAPDHTTDHAAQLILHAWLRWGDACVERIDGDFAFAIYDPREYCLFLARDRMGERPLYVHHVPGKRIVFGSTSHAVLAHPQVPEAINEARIADYFLACVGGGLEGVDFTSTFHTAVERHPPRHTLRVTPHQHQLRRYWQLEPGRAGQLPTSDAGWADALTEAMERAVAQRLAGPGRAGSMLSGGMDSTSLAIIASDQFQAAGLGPLPTFSAIDSSRPDCLETRAILTALGRPGFEPHLVDLANLGALLPELERFLEEFDEPFDASAAMLDAQYANAASAGLDGVFDGGNGDTLFLPGGALRRQIRAGHWHTAWRNAQGLTRFGGTPWQHLRMPIRAAMTPDWLRRLLAPAREWHWQQELMAQAHLNPAFAQRSRIKDRLRKIRTLRSPSPLDTANEAAEAIQHTFPVAGAERYARVAARHGITPLTPFSERRLLELCVNLPDRQRLRDGWFKPVLRQAMAGRMPESVRLRLDKEHLGSRLTAILWNRQQNLAEYWPAIAQAMSAYLAPVPPTQGSPMSSQHWTRHTRYATQLAHWLKRADAQPQFSAPSID